MTNSSNGEKIFKDILEKTSVTPIPPGNGRGIFRIIPWKSNPSEDDYMTSLK
jgi:hypothetical protein